MSFKLLTPTRKKILVFWYQYHVDTNLWPTFEKAGSALGISKQTICYHVNILEKEEWMIRDHANYRGSFALSKYGEGKLFAASLIASGQAVKETKRSTIFSNKARKRSK